MRPDQRYRGRRTTLALAVVAVLGLALLPAGSASAAGSGGSSGSSSSSGSSAADSLARAKQAAHAAALDVQKLQPQLQSAIAAYESALGRLANGVTAGVSADQAADESMSTADAALLLQRQRIRALYMSGGSTFLLASLLDSKDPQDLFERISSVRRVLSADAMNTQQALDAATQARMAADDSLAGADQLGETASSVQGDLFRVQGLMAAAQARLDSLSAQARQLQDARDAAAALAAAQASLNAAGASAAQHATGHGIPPDFLALYQAAAPTCPGLDWHVLAAIGQVESGHGHNDGPSSSGAEGPMQFMPGTFAAYAVDGNGDGILDIWSPADAIYTAAHYLCANGAGNPDKLYTAIWHYNHADWYVQLVLGVAASLRLKYPG